MFPRHQLERLSTEKEGWLLLASWTSGLRLNARGMPPQKVCAAHLIGSFGGPSTSSITGRVGEVDAGSAYHRALMHNVRLPQPWFLQALAPAVIALART